MKSKTSKSHPLSGRKVSPETIAKRNATRAAKAAGLDPIQDRADDALVFLTKAFQLFPEVKTRNGLPHPSKNYLVLAIQRLEGKS
jgi:hypothetical protein